MVDRLRTYVLQLKRIHVYIVCTDDISAHLTVTISTIYREQGTGQTLCKVYFYYFYVIKPETLYTPPTGASNPVIQFRAETAIVVFR